MLCAERIWTDAPTISRGDILSSARLPRYLHSLTLGTGSKVKDGTFSFGSTTLGTAKIGSTGLAVFSTTALPHGSDVVKATYAGNANYSAATASVTQTVN